MLLEDLVERRRGHRNVSDEEVMHALQKMDTDGDGSISVEEFQNFLSRDSLSNVKVVRTSA